MAADAEMTKVRAMDEAAGTNGVTTTDVVAASGVNAMSVIAETTKVRDMDVGAETTATAV